VLDIEHAFRLTDHFLDPYRHRPVPWGPVGLVTYLRSYARIIDGQFARPGEVGKVEEWWQTVRRCVEGCYSVQAWHCQRHNLLWSWRKAQASAQIMYDLIWSMKFLPPGRGLRAMGTDFVYTRGVGNLINCAFRSTKDIDKDFSAPFAFLMDSLMLDAGVGMDVRGSGKVVLREPRQGEDTHTVEDTREAWVGLIARILDAYAGKGTLPARIDVSQVRPQGVPIRGKGGTATGPGPLLDLVGNLHATLRPGVGKPVTTTAIADLCNYIGALAVHGSDRRSAEILLGPPGDDGFFDLKDPTDLNAWTTRLGEVRGLLATGANGTTEALETEATVLEGRIAAHPLRTRRWASNNSILAEEGQDYSRYTDRIAANGEPGFYWLENARTRGRFCDPARDDDLDVLGVNPCGEIVICDAETCNIAEVFPAAHDTYADFQRTLKWAYLYTKTVTLLPHHDPRTNAVMMRKRRIGLSQAGVQQAIARRGFRGHMRWCHQGYGYIRQLDRIYSDWLAIPRSVRVTTIKPGGTVPLLSGATPGIHDNPAHSKHYLRRIRFAAGSPLVEALERAGYPVEDDAYSGSTRVVSFPVHDPTSIEQPRSLWEQLELAAAMQWAWSDNAVSCTATFTPQEAASIPRALAIYESRLKGISLLPAGTGGYVQAPYEAVEPAEYEMLTAQLRTVDLGEAGAAEVEGSAVPAFCDGDRCVVG